MCVSGSVSGSVCQLLYLCQCHYQPLYRLRPDSCHINLCTSHSLSLPDISPLIKLKLFHISLSLQGLEVEMEVIPEVPSSTPTLTLSHSINIPSPSPTTVTVTAVIIMEIIIKITMVIIVVVIMVIMVEI